MNDTYTREQAMDRLGFRSANVFFQLERKYPEAFVVMKRGPGREGTSDTTRLRLIGLRRGASTSNRRSHEHRNLHQ